MGHELECQALGGMQQGEIICLLRVSGKLYGFFGLDFILILLFNIPSLSPPYSDTAHCSPKIPTFRHPVHNHTPPQHLTHYVIGHLPKKLRWKALKRGRSY
jgi:hypothetical protein